MVVEADKRVWQAEGEEKGAAVKEMFSEIAPTYDLLNSLLSMNLHHRWRRSAVATLQLPLGGTALDLCCGTGDFLPPLRRAIGPEGELVGVDFCGPMLERAHKKDANAALLLADAKEIPLAAGVFDGLAVGWGLRNVDDLERALSECFRVLKPGGRFACLDMARPRGLLGPMAEAAFHLVTPILGRLFGRAEAYTYLPKSAARFATREELAHKFESAGFKEVRWRDFFFGNVCLHTGVKP
jgi:demethylmenaquinone methyltransferase/2-methoxy-6-polyprenyl-1,4-benzoquinol methylase